MPLKPDPTLTLPETLGSVHFVGIGGSGMSGIAQLFLAAGHRVTGSDRADSPYLAALREAGATISIGHDAAHVGTADAVIVTSALWPENPEYRYALEHGIPVLHRSQALRWLTRGSRVIAIAGAHGKTTSGGMAVTALRALDADPSFVNGGVISGLGVSSALGADDEFVIEADESDGSFLLYDTAVALITNVDPDHLDHYGSAEAFDDAFVAFAGNAREFVALSADDAGARRIGERLNRVRTVTFGEAADADVRVRDLVPGRTGVSFTAGWRGAEHPVRLGVLGRHNALNAAGVFAVLAGLGHDPARVAAALGGFRGTARRFELKGTVRGVRVFDDYAHHPAEVAAVLSAARTLTGDGGGRIIAVHQPHLYSRTQLMAPEFARAYEQLADYTVVLDVDGAREDPVPGVTGELVTRAFADQARVAYLPDWSAAAERVAAVARPGDIVLTLSCGTVYQIIPRLLEALGGRGSGNSGNSAA